MERNKKDEKELFEIRVSVLCSGTDYILGVDLPDVDAINGAIGKK